MTAAPASRNAPCSCGSGKRYKECHGALASIALPAPSTRGAALLAEARSALVAGDAAAAEFACRAALVLAPENPVGWNLLGEILRAGDSTAAEAAWRKAIAIDTGNAEARFHLGNLYRERGDAQAAIAEYERGLAAAPGHVALQNNLGLALAGVGEGERAIACFRTVLAAQPDQPDALGNLANALFDRDDHAAATATYDRLFSVRSNLPAPLWIRRGIAQQKARKLAAAEESFREAAARAPDDAQILTNIGSLCVEQGRHADAEAPLARAFALDPANAYALAMLAHARQHRCAWDGLGETFAALEALLRREPDERAWAVPPFPLHAMPLSAQTLKTAAERWARWIAPRATPERPPVRLAPTERLRVGFVSTDFRAHPVAYLLMEVWERIDRERVETFAYGILPADTGPVGQRITRAFDHFVDLSEHPAGAIAQRIRTDRVAVLFDLNGYTQGAKPEVFARRPAPVQINSMGFPGTLGAPWYDYIHVDPYVAPPATEHDYTERPFHMPHAYVPSDTTRAPHGPPPPRAACGLPADAFVFCCFNAPYKILPEVFGRWLRLLAAVPGSVLWLLETGAEARANLCGEARRAGLAPERLVFAPKVAIEQHVARNAAADLFLDTSPYGAHTTTNDALLAGLPAITTAGDRLASRNPASQLRAIGLAELVTTTFADYEALARRLALDPAALADIRSRLAANRRTHPLFDMARYTRDFEDGLFAICRDHTGGTARFHR